jgi:hypothetical protein
MAPYQPKPDAVLLAAPGSMLSRRIIYIIHSYQWRFIVAMVNYRHITLAVVGLCLSLSFLASPVLAAEKDGVTMKDGKMVRLQEGKDIGRMDRETTMSNGTRVMMNGKMMMKDGKEMQLQEGQIMMLDGKLVEGSKGK